MSLAERVGEDYKSTCFCNNTFSDNEVQYWVFLILDATMGILNTKGSIGTSQSCFRILEYTQVSKHVGRDAPESMLTDYLCRAICVCFSVAREQYAYQR